MILHLSCQNSCSFLFSPFKNSPWFRTCSKLMLCDVSYIVGKEHTWSWWVMLSWYASKPTLKVMHAKCAINPRNTAFVSVFWCEWAVPLSKHHLQKSRLELSHGAELDTQTNSLWCLRFNHTLECPQLLWIQGSQKQCAQTYPHHRHLQHGGHASPPTIFIFPPCSMLRSSEHLEEWTPGWIIHRNPWGGKEEGFISNRNANSSCVWRLHKFLDSIIFFFLFSFFFLFFFFSAGNFRMKSSCIKARSPRVILVKCSDSLNAAWWRTRLPRALLSYYNWVTYIWTSSIHFIFTLTFFHEFRVIARWQGSRKAFCSLRPGDLHLWCCAVLTVPRSTWEKSNWGEMQSMPGSTLSSSFLRFFICVITAMSPT